MPDTLRTILGEFDYTTTPRVFVRAAPDDVPAIIAHENSHYSLANRSILGYSLMTLKAMGPFKSATQPLAQLKRELFSRTKFVQEALATYAECLVRNELRNCEGYRSSLPLDTYRPAFDSALMIDKIVRSDQPLTPEIIPHVNVIRYFLLLDIARVTFNFPFLTILADVPIAELASRSTRLLEEHDPTSRWHTILGELSEESRRAGFLTECTPLFANWVSKSVERQNGLIHTGIKYEDNAERIIASTVPHLAYRPFLDELTSLDVRSLSATSVVNGERSERYTDYLKREHSTSIEFAPQLPIRFGHGEHDSRILRRLKEYNHRVDGGCYVKVISNHGDRDRVVQWRAIEKEVVIPAHESMMLVHPARFSTTSDKKRTWNYPPWVEMLASTETCARDLVSTIATDDVMLCEDVHLEDADPFALARFAQNHRTPVFIMPEPRGTFDSFWRTLHDRLLRELGCDVYATALPVGWTQNDSLLVICVVPRMRHRNVTIVLFASHAFVRAVWDVSPQEWPWARFAKPGRLDSANTSFCKIAGGCRREILWERTGDRTTVPMNLMMAAAHMLDAGF